MYVWVLAVIGLYTMHLWLPQLYEYLFNAKEVLFQLCHVIVSSTFPWSLIWTRPSTYPSNRPQIVRVARRVQLMVQELLTLLEHLISLPLWTNLSWVRVIHFVTLHCLNVYSYKYSHISIDPFCVVTDIHICRHFHISHTSNFATLFLRVSCHQLCLHILSSLVLHGLHGVHV